jgi:hypothetical protein
MNEATYTGTLITDLTQACERAEQNAAEVEDIRKVCEPLEQERRRKRGEKLAGNLALIFMVGLYLYFCHSAWMELAR